MVKDNIPSALFFEDDADWDVNIKSQLLEYAKGSQIITGGTPLRGEKVDFRQLQDQGAPIGSPYGDDWDLLWLGHCGMSNEAKANQTYYVQENDPTSTPKQHRIGWTPNLSPFSDLPESSRYIFETGFGARCTAAYALSQRGARRLLYHQTLGRRATTSDRAVNRLCGGFMAARCLTSWPAIVGSFRPAGPKSRDSDRDGAGDKIRKDAESLGIAYSVRLNAERLLRGETVVKHQWPDLATQPELDLDKPNNIPEGYPVYITSDQYVEKLAT